MRIRTLLAAWSHYFVTLCYCCRCSCDTLTHSSMCRGFAASKGYNWHGKHGSTLYTYSPTYLLYIYTRGNIPPEQHNYFFGPFLWFSADKQWRGRKMLILFKSVVLFAPEYQLKVPDYYHKNAFKCTFCLFFGVFLLILHGALPLVT